MIITAEKLVLVHPVLVAGAGAVLQRGLDRPDLLGAAQMTVVVVHSAALAVAVVVTVPGTSERAPDRRPERSGHRLLSFKCGKQNGPKFKVLEIILFRKFYFVAHLLP